MGGALLQGLQALQQLCLSIEAQLQQKMPEIADRFGQYLTSVTWTGPAREPIPLLQDALQLVSTLPDSLLHFKAQYPAATQTAGLQPEAVCHKLRFGPGFEWQVAGRAHGAPCMLCSTVVT